MNNYYLSDGPVRPFLPCVVRIHLFSLGDRFLIHYLCNNNQNQIMEFCVVIFLRDVHVLALL